MTHYVSEYNKKITFGYKNENKTLVKVNPKNSCPHLKERSLLENWKNNINLCTHVDTQYIHNQGGSNCRRPHKPSVYRRPE